MAAAGTAGLGLGPGPALGLGLGMEARLVVACEVGDLAAVQRLLERGADAATCDNSPLRWAAEGGHTDVVRLLLALSAAHRVSPGARDNEALRSAAEGGHAATVRLLLELPEVSGVDPAARSNEALIMAALNGHAAIVRMLMALPQSRGVDPSAEDYAAVRGAASGGHEAALRWLLASGRPGVPAAVLGRLENPAVVQAAYAAAHWDNRGNMVLLRNMHRARLRAERMHERTKRSGF